MFVAAQCHGHCVQICSNPLSPSLASQRPGAFREAPKEENRKLSFRQPNNPSLTMFVSLGASLANRRHLWTCLLFSSAIAAFHFLQRPLSYSPWASTGSMMIAAVPSALSVRPRWKLSEADYRVALTRPPTSNFPSGVYDPCFGKVAL